MTDLLHGNHTHKSSSPSRLAASDNQFLSAKIAANLPLPFSLYVGLLYHRGNWSAAGGSPWGEVKEHNGKQTQGELLEADQPVLITQLLCSARLASRYLTSGADRKQREKFWTEFRSE